MPEAPTAPSRRALTKGIAWSAPVALVSVAAPAFAVSTPGLNGWVQVGTSCSWGTQTLTIDGSGSYPNRGLWVDLAPQSPSPQNAFIIFYFPSDLNLTWSAMSDNSGWSIPSVYSSAPPISGYTGYITRYTGTWQWNASARRQIAVGKPHFQVSQRFQGCRTITAYARRSVTLPSGTYAFTRGPVTLLPSNASPRGRSSAAPSDGGGVNATTPQRAEL